MSERLHIGIDARNASNARPGGFRTYILGILAGLRARPARHRYDLYFDRQAPEGIAPIGADGRARVVSARSRLLQENWALPRQMRSDRLDVAFFPGNVLPLLGVGCATVLTLHDAIQLQGFRTVLAESKGLRQSLINLYFARRAPASAQSATVILTVSQHARAQISRKMNIPLDRVFVAYNGVDRGVFFVQDKRAAESEVQARFGLGSDYVLAIGSSDRRKNVAAVIKGYAALPDALRGRHPLVVVLANSMLRAELEALAESLAVRNRLTLLTQLDPPRLASIYNAAAVYASPSLYESFALTVLEAMACGTPVVVSNTTSFPEIVGDAGLMVNPLAAGDLCAALERLLTDATLRAHYRQRGLDRSSTFDWKASADTTRQVFETAYELHRSRRAGSRVGASMTG